MNSTLGYIRKSNSKKNGVIEYFLVFWMIYASGIITFQYNNFIFLMLGTVIACFCSLCTPICIETKSKNSLFVFVLLECITLIQFAISVFDGHIYFGSVKMLLMLVFSILCCLRFSFKRFFTIFTNIIVVIATISIALYWFNINLVSSGIFPQMRTDAYTNYVNLFVYCINTSIMHRNCGVFWEPGAFQVFLNLALLYILHDSDFHRREIKIGILIIATLTTISTTGYICTALILMAYFINVNKKIKLKVFFLVLVILVAIGSFILPIFMESFAYKFGLGGGELSQNVTSRVNPFLLDIQLMSNNPVGLFGVDYYAEKIREYSGIYALPYVTSSCTVTMVAVVYGIFPGLAIAVGIVMISRSFLSRKVNRFLVIPILLMFSTESFLMFPFYYFMSFMGYKERRRDKT